MLKIQHFPEIGFYFISLIIIIIFYISEISDAKLFLIALKAISKSHQSPHLNHTILSQDHKWKLLQTGVS